MAFGVGQSLSGATRGKSQIHANASYRVVVVHEVLMPTYCEIASNIAAPAAAPRQGEQLFGHTGKPLGVTLRNGWSTLLLRRRPF